MVTVNEGESKVGEEVKERGEGVSLASENG
jgi:hypothetical protein